MPKISYSAVVLDNDSKKLLIDSVKHLIPNNWEIIGHHCTITLGELPNNYKQMIGMEVELTGSSFGFTDKAFAFRVDNYERLIKGQSHITVAIDVLKGGKPKDSNNIKFWNIKLGTPLTLKGIIKEIPFENETLKYNKLIVELLQKQIEEDTNGYLRFGQILGNLNINYFADTSDPSKQNFNLKDIYNQSSKEIYERMIEHIPTSSLSK